MTQANRRRAERVPVGILAQLDTPGGYVTARILDLSRAGLRLRAEPADLGVEAPEDADGADAAVRGALHSRFALSINHDRLGSLLQRHVELTRVELPGEGGTGLDLCCSFREPLEEAEVELLEAHLPPARAVVSQPSPPASSPAEGAALPSAPSARSVSAAKQDAASAPAGEGARQRYRAFVSAARSNAVQTFRCHTDLITAIGVRIALPRADYGDAPVQAAQQFARRYGTRLDLRISEGELDLWSGRVRVSGVEIPADRPDTMLVTLAFDRSLALHEMRKLGIVQRVA